MTTFTIDKTVSLKKTHFADVQEAIIFFVDYLQKEKKGPSGGSRSHYNQAMQDLENNTNVIALSEYMTKRGLSI